MGTRVYETFYLASVPNARTGQVSYCFPSNPGERLKTPDAVEILSLCFPDIEEIRKVKAVDFKAPAPDKSTASSLAQVGSQLSQLGVSAVGASSSNSPAGPPLLASTPTAAGNSYVGSSLSAIMNSGKPHSKAEQYTFILANRGDHLYGIVYRCLPSGFGMRYDVGKRYPECLCILTRHANAVPMFQQFLHQVHAMRLMFAPIDQIETLLGGLYNRPLPAAGEVMNLQYCVDKGVCRTYRYIWPAEGETPAGDALATLYLFQQLKPKAFLSLLTALLCERRVCFTATDMDKLTACIHAAVGLLYPLSWPHILIPALPASLLNYIRTSGPVIFGILRQQLPLLNDLPIDDLIYVDLDAGELSLAPHGHPPPDIYVLPNQSQVVQAAQKLGAEAAKAAEKLDKAFSKGVALLQKYTGQQLVKESDEPKPDAANLLAWELSLLGQSRAANPINWNARARSSRTDKNLLYDEQQLRDALLIFFVNLVGDSTTYLRLDRNGGLRLDPSFYLGTREMLGDGPALSTVLYEFAQTSIFARFAEVRKAQQQSGRSMSPRALAGLDGTIGPFTRCVEALRNRGETFSVNNIKKVLKSQAQQGSQLAAEGESDTSGRWSILHGATQQLTSASAAAGDAQRALNSVIEDSFSSILLPAILRVIWSRLADCRGLKWRHAHKSLSLLKELLIRGPESIWSEMLSNIFILRTFLEYRPGIPGIGGQGARVREAASDLFFLLLDGKRLMLLRSICHQGRPTRGHPKVRLSFEHVLDNSFIELHNLLLPSSEAPAINSTRERSLSTTDILSDAPMGDVSAFISEPDCVGEDRLPDSSAWVEGPLLSGSPSFSNTPASIPPSIALHSNSGSQPRLSANSSSPRRSNWMNFGEEPTFTDPALPMVSSPPPKPLRRPSAASEVQERATSPPLIQLSASPSTPVTYPPAHVLPPLQPLQCVPIPQPPQSARPPFPTSTLSPPPQPFLFASEYPAHGSYPAASPYGPGIYSPSPHAATYGGIQQQVHSPRLSMPSAAPQSSNPFAEIEDDDTAWMAPR